MAAPLGSRQRGSQFGSWNSHCLSVFGWVWHATRWHSYLPCWGLLSGHTFCSFSRLPTQIWLTREAWQLSEVWSVANGWGNTKSDAKDNRGLLQSQSLLLTRAGCSFHSQNQPTCWGVWVTAHSSLRALPGQIQSSLSWTLVCPGCVSLPLKDWLNKELKKKQLKDLKVIVSVKGAELEGK